MSFRSFLTNLMQPKKTTAPHRSRNKINHFDFQPLEPRQLLAGITYDAATKDLTIFGDAGNNSGRIDVVNGMYQAQIQGFGVETYALSDVDKVIFIGLEGDDNFTNGTSLESEMVGHAGNDTLRGGSGIDNIVGGHGNDFLFGNAGNDRIVGSAGNDTIEAGSGDDMVFGSFTGTNTIAGQDGNDTIYGGNFVDNIMGGNGIDKIFAFDGDDVINTGAGGVPSNNGGDVTAQGELVLGLGGNDRITGGGGWDVLYGGDGDDIIVGGSGQNWIFGQNGDDNLTGANNPVVSVPGNASFQTLDYIRGNLGNDTIRGLGNTDALYGDEGDDELYGGDGWDVLVGWTGNDIINGQSGRDRVQFDGNTANYKITTEQGRYVADDTRSNNLTGKDTISGFAADEFFSFVTTCSAASCNYEDSAPAPRDGADLLTKKIVIQPVIAANTNGTNRAEFFGDATSELFIKDQVDAIFLEAGLEVQWLAEKNWNNNFVNVGSASTRPTSDLGTIRDMAASANISSNDSQVINVFFVEKSPGFNDIGENTSVGLAFLNGPNLLLQNGVTIAIGDNLVTTEEGRIATAILTAHEVAHNLGLDHVSATNNLMNALPKDSNLTQTQINAIINHSTFLKDF